MRTRLRSELAPGGMWRDGLMARAKVLFGFVGVLWVIELFDWLILGGQLDQIGVRPREFEGMWGILLAPFLHGGPGHLLSNTGPLLWMGALIMVWGVAEFVTVIATVTVLGGLGTWLIGRGNSVHQGASALAFGFLGYLVARGFVERRPVALILAALTMIWYSSIIFGIFPTRSYISWEGHLAGLLAGIGLGVLRARQVRTGEG
jgi:membrane associated rhomboid family serine protease